VTNLTAITRPEEIALKHFVDSIAPATGMPAKARLLDIGSGGGFPGIPLKIIRPSLDVTLIDSSRKKVSFLKHVIRTLGLSGISAVHCRAESMSNGPGTAMGFDVVICRALASLEDFVPLALPLLAKKGTGMALKAKAAETEVAQAQRAAEWLAKPHLGAGRALVFNQTTYTLPFLDAERALVTFRRSGE
jgi:16S rRNA (guanine527-N7)-methyltransferase